MIRRALQRMVGKSNIYSGPMLLVFTLLVAVMIFVFRRFHVLLCIFATLPVPRSHCDIISLVLFRALTLVTIACS